MKHISLLFTLFIILTLNAQNITIDYQAWNPSNPPCNVFAYATNVPATGATSGVIEHQTKVGQPSYNNSIQAIQMPTNYVSSSSYQGTRFRIAYNFKFGYTYVIYVTMAADVNTSGFGTGPYLRVDVNNNGGGGNTGCNGSQDVNPNLSGNPAAIQVSLDTYSEYQFSPFTATSNQPTLEITTIPATNGGSKTMKIRKIRIVETAPTPTFTITPNTTSIPCGSTINKTFTVNNVYNSPGTLSYNWSLGSSNNGWIYQGSPAPQSFTTSQNNISLTSSSASSSYSNVAVTVVLNGSNYTTLTSNVTTTPLEHNMTITGANNICSSEIYTLNNLPSGGTIVSFKAFAPKFFISYTTSGNQITITRNGSNSGVVDITAVVATNCGNITVSRTVYLGPIPATIVGPFDPVQHTIMTPCTGEQYYFSAYPIEGGATYSWEIIPPVTSSENPYFLYGSTAYVNFSDTAGCYTIKLLKSDACGGTAITQQTVCTQECYGMRVTTSPNPATSILTVTLTDGKEERTKQIKQENIQIELYNFNTSSKQKEWKYNTTTQRQFTVNIADIAKGMYVVKVTKGKLQQISKIIIE